MLSLAFTGDIAFSKHFKNSYAKEDLLGEGIIDYLKDTDYVVANVEAPVTDGGITSKNSLVHANSPECIPTLKNINAIIWNLANNHTMDCGEEGLIDTLRLAKENGIQTIGAGRNIEEASKPLFLEKNGVKVGLLSVTYRWSVIATEDKPGSLCMENYELIKKQIRSIKNVCDYCVVIAHGCEEFTSIPLPFVRNHMRRYLRWGADCVVGHHPHVPQNYETFGKKIIFYSLGNFIFDTDYQRIQKYTDTGVLVKINFDKNGISWNNLCTKVDRENNRVVECEPITIFQDIQRREYYRLISLAEQAFDQNLYNKTVYLKEAHKLKDLKTFKKSKFRRFRKRERFAIMKAILERPLKRWKKASPELVEYIGGDLIKQKKN